MARAALRKCAEPGCRTLVRATRCDRHKKEYSGSPRNSTKAGYGYRWQKFRESWLKKHPLCVHCLELGQTTPAVDVDHIIPHRGDIEKFWHDIGNNVQGLCRSCHSKKTASGG